METALLIVDVQTSMIDEGPYDAGGLLDRINQLIAAARKAGVVVAFVRDTSVEPDGSVHQALTNSRAISKASRTSCDSFLQTDLEAQLQQRGIRQLVIAGMQTEYCIDTTVRSAAAHGYQVTLVGDAHTTYNSGDLTARRSSLTHNRVLDYFQAGDGT